MEYKDIGSLILAHWLSVLQTLVVIATLFAVIKYTIETKKLREATVKQNELQLRPFLSIFYDEHECFFQVINVGHSTALNTEIDKVGSFSFSFIHSDLMKPKESSHIYAIGPFKGGTGDSKNKIDLVEDEYELILRYKNVLNEHYFSKVKIRRHEALFIETGRDLAT